MQRETRTIPVGTDWPCRPADVRSEFPDIRQLTWPSHVDGQYQFGKSDRTSIVLPAICLQLLPRSRLLRPLGFAMIEDALRVEAGAMQRTIEEEGGRRSEERNYAGTHSRTLPLPPVPSTLSRRTGKPHSWPRCFSTCSASSPASGRPRSTWWRSVSERSPLRL